MTPKSQHFPNRALPSAIAGRALLVAAFAVALTTATAIVALRRVANESRQGELLLARLDGQSNWLEALEWQAIAKGNLEPELLEEVDKSRQQIEQMLAELTRLDLDPSWLRQVLENYREYSAAVDEEFHLIEVEDLDGARALDEERVDPASDLLHKAIAEAGAAYSENAKQMNWVADAGSASLAIMAMAAIGLLLWRFQRMHYQVALTAIEQELLAAANQELQREIAERRQAEAALHESETRFRTLVEQLPAITYIIALEETQRTLYVSPQITTVLGFSQAEWMADPDLWSKQLHPDDRERVLAEDAHSRLTGVLSAEYRILARDGRVVWLHDLSRHVYDEAGQARLSQGIKFDITHLKQTEAALRQSEAELRALFAAMTDVVIVYDRQGRYLKIAPTNVSLLYKPPDEMLGKALHDVLPAPQADLLLSHIQRALDEQGALTVDYSLNIGGREFWFAGMISPMPSDAAILVARDITERKRAEEQIKASLREKEALLKEIHHRVKNNLQVISSLLNLQSYLVAEPRVLELLRDSQNRVRSMALVHEKLYRSSDLARIDFAEYVRSLTAQLIRSYSDNSHQVELKAQTDSIWLDVDTAVSCGLIINELVSNALKHAFPNGRAGEICLELARGDAGRLTLRVSDTGVGFPANVDFRNTPSLGLQLVNTLVEQIGGAVDLECQQGTAFKIIFTPPSVEEKR